MPTWQPPPTAQQPDVVVERWRVLKVQSHYKALNNTVHIVGYNAREDEGRVSSAITKWDKATMRATTQSGRVYHLAGQSGGESKDADYVWRTWCSRWRVKDWVDVSSRYQPRKPRRPKL